MNKPISWNPCEKVAEVSDKSRQLAKVLAESCMVRDAYDVRSLDQETAAQRIEQALLAERRLAMEEAEEIVRNTFGAKTRFIQALRAAAEKESGPRGGE